jgi:transglutaminase-like putative cysteine protease
MVLSAHHLFAQDNPPYKFGKITNSDFNLPASQFDSGANAVIIADVGKTIFTGNGRGFFSIVFTRSLRVRILNKNGFNIANTRVFLYNDREGTLEKVTDLKGSTYNLENGEVQETKLDSKTVYTVKYSRYVDEEKFTMPALKVGSVYDLTYTVKSNYFSELPNWYFQSGYPCLWSDYQVEIPSMFHYLVKTNGDDHFDIKTTKTAPETYSINDDGGGAIGTNNMARLTCTALQFRWVKKNVPALAEQPYISTVDNYKSKISFEYNYFKWDNLNERHNHIVSWDTLSHYLLIDQEFGFELNEDNPWMDEDLKEITKGSESAIEETKRIYHFVRDNYRCTDYSDIFVGKSLRDVYKKRVGNVGEINLLLVAMLRHRHIPADPAILSKRDNGVASKDYPLLREYNYLICIAHAGDGTFRLDASRPYNPFNELPAYCLNWGARVINETNPQYIELSPDSVSEVRTTSVMFSNEDNGNFSGSLRTTFGSIQSSSIREEIRKTSTVEYFKADQAKFTDLNVSNEGFDTLEGQDQPLVLHYDLDFKDLKSSDILYFSPVLGSSFTSNPFTATERLFPIEMESKIDFTYLLSMEVPKGFRVDELPKSARANYAGNQAVFEYLVQQGPDNIQMKVHLKFNQASFPTDQYSTLRDFFAYVVKKESEQIVFKKIK